MLESVKDNEREDFRAAIERARENGLSLDDMASMITAAADTERSNGSVQPTEPEDIMYEPGNLPEGLIDLPSASKKYGIPGSTLRNWLLRGKLPRRGRVRARAAGGGYVVVSEAEVKHCRDNPLKTGRKKRATP